MLISDLATAQPFLPMPNGLAAASKESPEFTSHLATATQLDTEVATAELSLLPVAPMPPQSSPVVPQVSGKGADAGAQGLPVQPAPAAPATPAAPLDIEAAAHQIEVDAQHQPEAGTQQQPETDTQHQPEAGVQHQPATLDIPKGTEPVPVHSAESLAALPDANTTSPTSSLASPQMVPVLRQVPAPNPEPVPENAHNVPLAASPGQPPAPKVTPSRELTGPEPAKDVTRLPEPAPLAPATKPGSERPAVTAPARAKITVNANQDQSQKAIPTSRPADRPFTPPTTQFKASANKTKELKSEAPSIAEVVPVSKDAAPPHPTASPIPLSPSKAAATSMPNPQPDSQPAQTTIPPAPRAAVTPDLTGPAKPALLKHVGAPPRPASAPSSLNAPLRAAVTATATAAAPSPASSNQTVTLPYAPLPMEHAQFVSRPATSATPVFQSVTTPPAQGSGVQIQASVADETTNDAPPVSTAPAALPVPPTASVQALPAMTPAASPFSFGVTIQSTATTPASDGVRKFVLDNNVGAVASAWKNNQRPVTTEAGSPAVPSQVTDPAPAAPTPQAHAPVSFLMASHQLATPPEAPPTSSAAPILSAAKALNTPVAPEPQAATGQLNNLSFRVPQADGSSVQVRLVQQSGELKLAVHTASTGLNQGLRDSLPELTKKLSDSGFHAEAWRPGVTTATASAQTDNGRQSGGNNPGGSDSQQQGGSGNQQGRNQQRDQKPSSQSAWADELANGMQANNSSFTGALNGLSN